MGTKNVKRVSIFSPMLAEEENIVLKTHEDFIKNPSMVLFEGYIDGQGNPYATDRRMPKHIRKNPNLKTNI